MTNRQVWGRRIASARGDRTQAELADALNDAPANHGWTERIYPETVARWEDGYTYPSLAMQVALCRVFDLRWSVLFHIDPDTTGTPDPLWETT